MSIKKTRLRGLHTERAGGIPLLRVGGQSVKGPRDDRKYRPDSHPTSAQVRIEMDLWAMRQREREAYQTATETV